MLCNPYHSPLHMFTLGRLGRYPFPLRCTVSVHRRRIPSSHWYNYYSKDADIVCSRAKNHYPPGGFDTETGTQISAATDLLERQKKAYMPLNSKQANLMYFMVGDLLLLKFITYGSTVMIMFFFFYESWLSFLECILGIILCTSCLALLTLLYVVLWIYTLYNIFLVL